jgi:hypothetical protein
MPKKISSKTYIVYDARAMTLSLADALIVFSTHDQQEAFDYANAYHGTVYAYDTSADGALINATLLSHAADEQRATQ